MSLKGLLNFMFCLRLDECNTVTSISFTQIKKLLQTYINSELNLKYISQYSFPYIHVLHIFIYMFTTVFSYLKNCF